MANEEQSIPSIPAGAIPPAFGQPATLGADVLAHLASEAERRGISVEEAYRDEMAAKKELAKLTPRNADLLQIAERFPAPQSWCDE